MNVLKKLSLALLFALPFAAGAASRPATPFTDAEIDQMLAPIALYPDAVLSHVLIAATVPDDVDAAAEWLDRHPDVKGQAAVDAVERMPWDPSVKALVAFPDVIERMQEDPDWTEDLGLAFLEQEATVMDRVQVLRDRADDNGTLDDVEHVKVVREKEYIYLEPAVSHVMYVPYYDPWFVYGSWWWASYPPHCWSWWGGYPARYYGHSAFFWGVSYHYGPTWYVGSFNWPRRHVVVTRPHRYYTPSPGYSGRSTMRRDNVHHDLRRSHDSRGWREDTRTRPGHERRNGAPVRRGHRNHDDSGGTHLPQGPRSGNRRSWSEVNARLADGRTARREDSSRRAYESTRHGGGTRRADNPQRRDGWLRGERAERATRPVEGSRSGRSYSTDRGAVPRESRPQSRPERSSAPAARSEPRSGGREVRNDGGSGRSEARGAGRGSSHGDGGNGGARVRARGDR